MAAMMTPGVWIYGTDKRWYWYERGRVYASPRDVPPPNAKRPYHDPGKALLKVSRATVSEVMT